MGGGASQADYDNYVKTNGYIKQDACPACEQKECPAQKECPKCEQKECPACVCEECKECEECDYSNYKPIAEYQKLQKDIEILQQRPESCDYSKHKTLDEYNKLNEDLTAQVNDYKAKYEKSVAEAKNLATSSEGQKKTFNDEKNKLNDEKNMIIGERDNLKKELDKAKADRDNYANKYNSLASLDIGDFKNFIGKTFLLKNRAQGGNCYVNVDDGFLKLVDVNKKIGAFKLNSKSSATRFTVDSAGHLFCKYAAPAKIGGILIVSNKSNNSSSTAFSNMVSFDGNPTNGARIKIVAAKPETFGSCQSRWRFEGNKIKSICNAGFGWDIPGGAGDVRNGVSIQLWADDNGEDRLYDIEVVESFTPMKQVVSNCQSVLNVIAVVLFVIVFVQLFRFLYKTQIDVFKNEAYQYYSNW